jgi:hypothetical protein
VINRLTTQLQSEVDPSVRQPETRYLRSVPRVSSRWLGNGPTLFHIRRRTPLRLTRWLWVVKRCHHSAQAVIGPGQILPIDLRHDGVVRIVDHGRAGGKPGSTRPPPEPGLLRVPGRRVLTLNERAAFGVAQEPASRSVNSEVC